MYDPYDFSITMIDRRHLALSTSKQEDLTHRGFTWLTGNSFIGVQKNTYAPVYKRGVMLLEVI